VARCSVINHTSRPIADRWWLGERPQGQRTTDRKDRTTEEAPGSKDRAVWPLLVIIVGKYLRNHHTWQFMKELIQERFVTFIPPKILLKIFRNPSNVTLKIVKQHLPGKKILFDIPKVTSANGISNALNVEVLLGVVIISEDIS
jgi:hypothetical protein